MKKLLAITLGVAPALVVAASLMPQGKQAYFDANGDPLAGGKVYTYAAGTSTPLDTYSDQAGATPNANPVVLDARGEATIFWGASPYKVSLYTSADVLVWTQDNLYPPLTAGEALALYSGGNASAPELTWADDTNSGLYHIGADNIGITLGGTKRWDFGTAGTSLTGTFDVSGATSLASTLTVRGAATFSSTATFTGAATLNDPVSITDALTVTSTSAFTFDATFTGSVNVPTPTANGHAATKAYVDAPTTTTATLSAGANWTLGTNTVRRAGKAVFVEVTAAATNNSALWGEIAVVPAGYRPTGIWEGPCRIQDATTATYYGAWCGVAADGGVSMVRYDDGTAQVAPWGIDTNDTVGVWASYVQ
jgi:hypothetical protein